MVTRRAFLSGMAGATSIAASVGLARAELPRQNIPSDIGALQLSGFAQPGDAGRGAIYVRGKADGLMAIQDADGDWWNLSPGSEVWVGWFGALAADADDTAALQAAIDWVAALPVGGAVNIASGVYRVAQTRGWAQIGAHDDGAVQDPEIAPLSPEGVDRQAYCLALPANVRLQGHGQVVFRGSYRYGEAKLSDPICVAIGPAKGVINYVGVSNIRFERYFFAIAHVDAGVVVSSKFMDLMFINCAFGFYAKQLERCSFDEIAAYLTGCVIAVGGQWATRATQVSEAGGFADKCDFGVLHNVYGRLFGEAEDNIDSYFDRYFFKTINNKSRLGVREPAGDNGRAGTAGLPPTRFPYRGVCGRTIYIMARSARPSNANYFRFVSHAFAPRPAVWIDAPLACRGELVYLEGCGYRDNERRLGAIGIDVTDPYLGPGVRVPAFVRGYECMIDAQFVVCDRLVQGNELPDRFSYASNITHRQEQRIMRDVVAVKSLTVRGESSPDASGGGTAVISQQLDPHRRQADVKLPSSLGSMTAFVMVNTRLPEGQAKSTLYLVTIGGSSLEAALLNGDDVISIAYPAPGTLTLAARGVGTRHAIAIVLTGGDVV